MPETEVIFFKDRDGTEPFSAWLDRQSPKVQKKCLRVLKNLEDNGHELRRPRADYLRDGIHELRIQHLRVQYRILYFFGGKQVAVVSHGLSKEEKVPERDIAKALARKADYEQDPERHF